MTKDEFISKYGEDAYEQHKLKCKKWRHEHKERHNQLTKNWQKEHRELYNHHQRKRREQNKEQYNYQQRKRREAHRRNGCTPYCTKDYELIQNYELAKADNFDPKKWHLHHRLENYWSKSTLKRKGLYYDVNPEALIWLPSEEHMKDRSCKDTKWHKRSLENE